MKVAVVTASSGGIAGQNVHADLLARNWLNDPRVNIGLIPIAQAMPAWVRGVEDTFL
jgi:hypothetical protein